MPTTKHRYVVTETDQVAKALDDAAQRWPHDRGSRSKLLVHLVEEGHRALLRESEERHAARRAAVERTSGAVTGTYGPGYLADLREDWHE
jgi:hypothetical protein